MTDLFETTQEVKKAVYGDDYDRFAERKYNFAIIRKTENEVICEEMWILANAYYDYEHEKFIKIDKYAISLGIQIQAKGNSPGYNFWMCPAWLDSNDDYIVEMDDDYYDYTDMKNEGYIGAEYDNEVWGNDNGTWRTFGIATGWNPSTMVTVDSVLSSESVNPVRNSVIKAALDSKNVTITKQATAEEGYAATYVLNQGGTVLSPKINIPKDFLVKSATVETCEEDDNPVEGYIVGDKYLDFVVNSVDNDDTASHIYLKVTELVDVYSADNSTLVLGTGNVFSLKDGGVTYAKIASAAIGTGSNQIAAGNHAHSDYVEKSVINGLLKNDGTVDTSTYLTNHQDITGKLDISQPAANKGKNVVVDSTTGDITFEDKPTIPTVVDTVADGNSNAVTSNAVYDYVASIIGDIDTWLVS